MKQTLTIRPLFECVRAEQLSRKPSAFFDDISKQNKAMIVETDGGGRVLAMPAEWMEPFNDPNMHLIVILLQRNECSQAPGHLRCFEKPHHYTVRRNAVDGW